MVAFAQRTIDLVATGAHSAAAILSDTDRRLMDIQAGHFESRMQSVGASIHELSADLDWRMEHRGEVTGVDTGYASVNELTLGWQPGDLIIIGARPSIGKTTLAINMAVHAASTLQKDGRRNRVAIFSLEMRRRQLEYRMLSQLAVVPLTRILSGYLGDVDFPKMAAAMEQLAQLPIEIDDRALQTSLDIRAACRRMKAEGGLDLVIVDYVQLLEGSLDRRGATRNDELTDISRRIQQLAHELAAPIILLSQLSRPKEGRPDPRPKLSDLRESGSLEQAADIVALLHRKNHREGGVTNFILEKQRNGATGTVNLTLDRDVVTFLDGGEEQAPEAKPEPEKKATRAAKHS
jgi:replicative DNA helicase